MCLDARWMEWMNAFMANKDPNFTVPGIGYMLQGGTDASNTDPFFSTDPASGGPWIMFPGTPYEYIMMPVASSIFPTSSSSCAASSATTSATPSNVRRSISNGPAIKSAITTLGRSLIAVVLSTGQENGAASCGFALASESWEFSRARRARTRRDQRTEAVAR